MDRLLIIVSVAILAFPEAILTYGMNKAQLVPVQ